MAARAGVSKLKSRLEKFSSDMTATSEPPELFPLPRAEDESFAVAGDSWFGWRAAGATQGEGVHRLKTQLDWGACDCVAVAAFAGGMARSMAIHGLGVPGGG